MKQVQYTLTFIWLNTIISKLLGKKMKELCKEKISIGNYYNAKEINDFFLKKRINETIRFRKSTSLHYIEFINSISLNGRTKSFFNNISDGSIITLFDKTPLPTKPEDVVCPHFIELKWANGCRFDCSWCYLNGTLRFRPMKKKPYMKDKSKIQKHIRSYLEQSKFLSLLNSGELADSLVFEGTDNALSKIIIPLFRHQKRHKLLILTKSTNISEILSSESQEFTIISFSINAFDVAKKWERKSPSPKQRILAAKRLYKEGYKVRIRIDPLVPVKNWESKYTELIEYLFTHLTPERITIGSLRGLQSTVNNVRDKTWITYLDERSNWGRRISFNKRFQMYSLIIDYLRRNSDYENIGLCKETLQLWDSLKMNYKKIKCNCLL